MKPNLLLLLLQLTTTVYATVNGRCTTSDPGWKDYGICISKAKCDSYKHGVRKANLCPYDGSDIQCCVIAPCQNEPVSQCQWTSVKCPGNAWVSSKLQLYSNVLE
jgi:hypothetical protein